MFRNLVPRTSGDDAVKDPAGPETGTGADEDAKAPRERAEDASSKPEAPEAPRETGKAGEADGSGEAASEPESDRLKAAVAAWVATAAEEPRGDAHDDTADDADDDTAGGADGEKPAGKTAEAGPAAGKPSAAEPEPSEAREAAASTGASAESASVEDASDTSDAEGTESTGKSGNAGKPGGVEDAGGAGKAGSGRNARETGTTEAPGTPRASVPSPGSAPASPSAADSPADPSPEDGTGTGKAEAGADETKSKTEAETGAGTEADEEPVDQPTAMFRTVRPPVDQPTTALKLPGGPKGTGADPDSERTSTFLPLRPDIPAERKAEREREAVSTASAAAPGSPASPGAPGAPASAPVPPALAEAERTRQQPLPPLPPLDLLAELTNTPPPPPTPLRTTVRRLRIWTPLVLLLLIVFAIAQMVRPLPAPALSLTAAPTFTFEGGALNMPWPGEGQGAVEVEGVGSMGTYGPQKPAPIASVTKTMTAYVILRDHPLKGKATGPEIKVDKKAADQGRSEHESTAPVKEGQTYTEKELLELLMIPSANNVARLLARWDAGSEAAFVQKMNAAAKDLGMTQSAYTDPSGLLDSTVSTPQDQLKLAKAVMQYDVFREIVNMPNVTVEGIPGRIENNNNILLKPGVSGIKTGSSTPAGGNLLWAANTVVDGQNRRILGIVMGAKDAELLNDKLQLSIDYSYELIKQAQKDVTSAVVIRKGQVLGHVDDGLGGRTPVVATKELKAVGWPGLKVKLELADGGRAVPHSGRAGDVVGQVSIGTGAGRVSSPVALQTDLVEPGFDKKLTRVG
ncbi:serine hydrolase [Streptomyces sp. NPDC001744]|uniref:serine hydrolase n=1 Tax=Streptomyces sp. NPDC001744 TaxID=3364606 RepID=UPI0036C7872C